MKKIELKQTFNKLKFKTMKNAPALLVGAGVVGVVGASILACKATLTLVSVLDAHKEDIEQVHAGVANEELAYDAEDAKRDINIIYSQTTLKVAKIYTPAVVVGALSIFSIIQSHNILSKRNVAIAAALTTVNESFAKYRKSVVDKYGERIDFELRHGIKSEKVTVKDENGKNKKEVIDVATGIINPCSDYARYFDQNCGGWEADPEYNLMFLKAQQQYANDRLIAKGYVYLNDVYDMLDIPQTKAGQMVGWVYNPDNKDVDNYIDFGIYNVMVDGFRDDKVNDTIGEERVDFVNGYRTSILLDFNVDGNIWDKM